MSYKDYIPEPPQEEPAAEPQQTAPKLLSYSDVIPEAIKWYWYPFIRRGTVSTITATQDTGKSFLMCKVVSMASKGERHKLPFHDLQYNYTPFDDNKPETTIYLNAEDDPSTDTIWRLQKCGADMQYIKYVDSKDMSFNLHSPYIEEWLKECRPSAVIFDPVQQFFVGKDPYGDKMNMNDSQSVRPALTHLKDLAKKYNTAIILICHTNKNSFHNALHSTMGSNDFTAAPRSAVFIGRNPDSPDPNNAERVITLTKANSVPDKHKKSLAYIFDMNNGGIVFTGESELKADDVTGRKQSSKADEVKETKTSKAEQAIEWLEEYLTANGGYAIVKDIHTQADADGIAVATLNRAFDSPKGKHIKAYNAKAKGKGRRITYWYFIGKEPPELQAEEAEKAQVKL